MPYKTGLFSPGSSPQWFKGLILTADISLTPVDTFKDVATLGSLPIGTYLIFASASTVTVTGITLITAKLWDGTTSYAAGEASGAINGQAQITLPPTIVVLAAAATIKLSVAAHTDAQTTVQYTIPTNGTGLTALGTQINALRIA